MVYKFTTKINEAWLTYLDEVDSDKKSNEDKFKDFRIELNNDLDKYTL